MHYYISLAGNDSNDGSYANPWLTPGKVSAEAVAGTFQPGDVISFRGGDVFTGATASLSSISMNGVSGTAQDPIIVTSYDTGRAEIATTGAAITPLSATGGASYLEFRNINLTAVAGAAAGGRVANIDGTTIKLSGVELTGGQYGAFCLGSVELENVVSRWGWISGIHVGGGSVTASGVTIEGSGYDVNYAAKNGTAGEGFAVNAASGSINGDIINAIGCKHAVNTAAAQSSVISRTFFRVSRADQEQQVDIAGTSQLINCIGVYSAVAGVSLIGIQAGATGSIVNCTLMSTLSSSGSDAGARLLSVSGTANVLNTNLSSVGETLIEKTAGATYTGMSNNFFSSAASPTIDGGAPTAISAWITANETGSVNTDPGYTNLTVSSGTVTTAALDARLAEVPKATPMFLKASGAFVKAMYFDANGLPYVDFYGRNRPPAPVTSWTIGASEPEVTTYQDITLAGGVATYEVTSPDALPTYAALLRAPATTKGYSFYVEAGIEDSSTIFSRNDETVRIGVWALGSRLQAGSPRVPITTRDVWDPGAFTTAGLTNFSDYPATWQLGPVNLTDKRRIIAYVDGEINQFRLFSEDSDLGLDISVTVPSYLRSVLNQIIRIEFTYKGRRPGGVNGSYVYDISGIYGGKTLVFKPGIEIPASWIEGINNPLGRADYAGLYAELDNDLLTNGWSFFRGSVTSALSSTAVGFPKGQAREAAYAASRRQAQNLLLNGGFTRYPRDTEIVRLKGVVRRIKNQPAQTPNSDVGVHLGFVVDVSNSTAPFVGRMKTIMSECINNLPADGSVMVTIIEHWAIPNTVVQPTILDPTTVPMVQAAISGMGATQSGEDWAGAWSAMTTAMTQAGGSYKAIFNITDHTVVQHSTAPLTGNLKLAVDGMHAIPGLSEVSLLLAEARVDQVYDKGVWPQVYFPKSTPVNSPIAANPWESSVAVPNTAGAVAISVEGDAGSTIKPSVNAGLSGAAADIEVGQNVAVQVGKWRAAWQNQLVSAAATPPSYEYKDAFQALPQRNPGFSLRIPESRPAEADIGGWYMWGSPAVVEVIEPSVMASGAGGNLLKVILGADGGVTLAQPITDLRALAGQDITVSLSANPGNKQARIDVILVVNGEDRTLTTAYSRSFGVSSRMTEVTRLPFELSTLELQIRVSGAVDTSVFLSGAQVTQGDYAPVLPFSESVVDSIIPPGTVIMYQGSACPPGYRQLPGSVDRIPYGFLGDPNFYERNLGPVSTAQKSTYDSDLDIGILVDGSSDQAPYDTTIHAWLSKMIDGLPKDGSVRVVVVFTNKSYPAHTLVPLVSVTPSSIASTIQPAIDSLIDPAAAPFFGQNDRIFQGLDAIRFALSAANGAKRMLVWNINHTYGNDSRVTTSLNNLYGIPRFAEASAVAIGSTVSQVTAVYGGARAYPAPHTTSPGIIFQWTGGVPGSAPAGQFSNQPIPAGEYTASVFLDLIAKQLPSDPGPNPVVVQTAEGVKPNRLGGYLEHDHANGQVLGSSTDESDGFEPAGSGDALTSPTIPIRDTKKNKNYPFGSFPSLTRPEDEPVEVIGPNHQHRVNTKMEAQPPGWRVRFCEKV